MLTRFAPSPTGYLHLGHARAAKEAFGFAKAHDGTCLLRIEDIDHTRCKAKYIDAIYEDLDWLGFIWPAPVRVQSENLSEYKAVIKNLRERGLIYRCFKTRAELINAPAAPVPRDEEAKLLSKGKVFAWRLSIAACHKAFSGKNLTYIDTDIKKTVDFDALQDIVLARKDIGTSYHIAVTHDDALQKITHIVRGADFIDQTPYHVLLQNLMGYPTPIYHHHDLLLRDDGEKLSKRSKDTTIRSLRENGLNPREVLNMATA